MNFQDEFRNGTHTSGRRYESGWEVDSHGGHGGVWKGAGGGGRLRDDHSEGRKSRLHSAPVLNQASYFVQNY